MKPVVLDLRGEQGSQCWSSDLEAKTEIFSRFCRRKLRVMCLSLCGGSHPVLTIYQYHKGRISVLGGWTLEAACYETVIAEARRAAAEARCHYLAITDRLYRDEQLLCLIFPHLLRNELTEDQMAIMDIL